LRIEVDGPNGVTTMPPPDATYFGGSVAGETHSLVFLAATPDGVHGFVVRGDATYAFGPDGTGRPSLVRAPRRRSGAGAGAVRVLRERPPSGAELHIPAPRATMDAPHAAASEHDARGAGRDRHGRRADRQVGGGSNARRTT
jgi:hypothetical protein